MTETIKLKSPIDGSIYVERPVATDAQVSKAVEAARAAQPGWARCRSTRAANTCSPCWRRWSA
jgi:acyl-CoA reductase-like NAD-dependent aldehyde dehydrogenase